MSGTWTFLVVFVAVSAWLGVELIRPHSLVNSWINPPGSGIILDYSVYGYVVLFMAASLAVFVLSTLVRHLRAKLRRSNP